MKSLVSIIVPCYNQAQYLDECLQSVLEQTYKNWECILVNDGSPDNTEEIAKKWLEKDNRFYYLYKENGGLSSARNAGIKIANGEFIQFLDADDILESNKISHQSQFFDKKIDVLISGYRYFENNEGISKLRIMGRNNFLPERIINFDDCVDVKNVIQLANPFVICAALFNKNAFDKVGFFDEQLFSLEDWDFNFRCALNNLIFHHTGYSEKAKVLVRLHDSSMMRNNAEIEKAFIELKNKWYQNDKYQYYFGITKINSENKIKSSNLILFKNILLLFIPPIFLKIKNKLFKK